MPLTFGGRANPNAAEEERRRAEYAAARRAAVENAALVAAGQAPLGNEGSLREFEADYERIPGETERAVAPKLPGESPEEHRKRLSEAKGQTRGALAASMRRQNAIRKLLGLDTIDEDLTPAPRPKYGLSATNAPPAGGLADLKSEEEAYAKLPGEIETDVKGDAERAGTYADTPEFLSGLKTETDMQTRGAQAASIRRQQALRRRMGLVDATAPEGAGPQGAWSPLQ